MLIWFENLNLTAQFFLLLPLIMLPVLLIQWAFNRSASLREYAKGAETTLMNPIALCFGLMASFIFVEVITLYEKAKAEVTQEASALQSALDLFEIMPAHIRLPLEKIIYNHVNYVVQTEWQLMRQRSAHLFDRDDFLVQSYKLLASYEANTALEAELQKRVLGYLEKASASQTYRLIVSQSLVHPVKWAALFVLAILVQLALAISHADKPKIRWVSMMVFTIAEAAYFMNIVAFNHAFGGDVFVTPDPLLKLLEAYVPQLPPASP